MVLGPQYIKYLKDTISRNKNNQSDLEKELKSEFKTYDELLQVLLFFIKEAKERYLILVKLQSLLKKLGITDEEIRNYLNEDFDEGALNFLEHRNRVKKGLKIAYKHHASVEACINLMAQYHNIDKVASILGVSRSTVWRRLKEAQKQGIFNR